jgi:hypothetical protein
MRSLIASVVVLMIVTMIAVEVGDLVRVRISALSDAVSMSQRSASR